MIIVRLATLAVDLGRNKRQIFVTPPEAYIFGFRRKPVAFDFSQATIGGLSWFNMNRKSANLPYHLHHDGSLLTPAPPMNSLIPVPTLVWGTKIWPQSQNKAPLALRQKRCAAMLISCLRLSRCGVDRA